MLRNNPAELSSCARAERSGVFHCHCEEGARSATDEAILKESRAKIASSLTLLAKTVTFQVREYLLSGTLDIV